MIINTFVSKFCAFIYFDEFYIAEVNYEREKTKQTEPDNHHFCYFSAFDYPGDHSASVPFKAHIHRCMGTHSKP